MNEQQITDRLIAAHSAYVEKTGKQPYMGPTINIEANENVSWWIYGASVDDRKVGQGKTFAAALDALDDAIAAIPSAEEQARNEAAKAVANAIEKCRAAGYDGEVLQSCRALCRALVKGWV